MNRLVRRTPYCPIFRSHLKKPESAAGPNGRADLAVLKVKLTRSALSELVHGHPVKVWWGTEGRATM